MKWNAYICFATAALVLCGCAVKEDRVPMNGSLRLTSSVESFEGEDGAVDTRTTLAGTAFALRDRMKLKIICPYTTNTNIGETTYGNTFDAFWLLKWDGSDWIMITAEDEVDVGASYRYSGAYNLFGQYEAQQTPYVYTASTWSENVLFVAGGSLQSQYSYIFQADQSLLSNYLKSDLLWAQTYMQTGSYDVHLSFNHVMACLKIDISALSLSANAVVTLEGMPDIDQKEVVVGDYYAAKSKVNSRYGYKDKCTAAKANNGKVMGVAYIDEAAQKAKVSRLSGSPVDDNTDGNPVIANTGVYKAYHNPDPDAVDKNYYLIVPPCVLTDDGNDADTDNPVLWVRDGATRYSFKLNRTTFEQGKIYPITVTVPPTPDPDPDPTPDPTPEP